MVWTISGNLLHCWARVRQETVRAEKWQVSIRRVSFLGCTRAFCFPGRAQRPTQRGGRRERPGGLTPEQRARFAPTTEWNGGGPPTPALT